MSDRRRSILAALGVAGGLAWVALAFAPVDGSSEVFWNRLWAPCLLAMAAGWLALRSAPAVAERPGSRVARAGLLLLAAGLVAMAAGNVAEYWIFVAQTHEEGLGRNLSWMGLLLGLLVVLVGATIAGVALLRDRRLTPWVAAPLAALGPLTVAAGLIAMSLVGIPLGIAAVLSGLTARGDAR